jgi:uncharacterized repeat protein (TIGR03803 family)
MKHAQQQRNLLSRMRVAAVRVVLTVAVALVPACITTQALQAQTFTTLHSFDGTDGADVAAAELIQATDGNLYGTTTGGGLNSDGTVFKITPKGTLTTLHSFDSTDGATPWAGLVQATNGNFYGTTTSGGLNSEGTVFKITPGGTFTTLQSFDGTDGGAPYAGLVQATNGDFYGTAGGGANGYGTVFQITPGGTLTTLHSFDSTDGSGPQSVLVQASDGNLYGTTRFGGSSNGCSGGCGTVFKMTLKGTLTTLHSFDSTDGANPFAGLVQASNGNLYGTTLAGGASNDGTVFRITLGGTLTIVHSFDGTDGNSPMAVLVQATDGNLYGTTKNGGSASCPGDCGTIFRIAPGGKLTTLHSFDGTDGEYPFAGLVQHTNGNLYGATGGGGTDNDGTVFSLSVGLGPFVETQTTSGKVGATVKILGTNLTGATDVTFDGTGATFTVVSKSEITTTVPSGATTGPVEVTIPNGILKSNTEFRVTP